MNSLLLILIPILAMLATPTNAWRSKPPRLVGPDAIVPLLLQCFQDGGYPCTSFETVAAAYRDKDTEERLVGNRKILTNQDPTGKAIEYIDFKQGKVDYGDNFGYWYGSYNLIDGYGVPDDSDPNDVKPTDDFLMYCCFRKQFIEGGEGASRMLRGANVE